MLEALGAHPYSTLLLQHTHTSADGVIHADARMEGQLSASQQVDAEDPEQLLVRFGLHVGDRLEVARVSNIDNAMVSLCVVKFNQGVTARLCRLCCLFSSPGPQAIHICNQLHACSGGTRLWRSVAWRMTVTRRAGSCTLCGTQMSSPK